MSIDVGQIRLDEEGFTRFDKGAQVVECRLMLSGEALYPMRPRSDRRLGNDVAADLGQLAVRHVRCDQRLLVGTTVGLCGNIGEITLVAVPPDELWRIHVGFAVKPVSTIDRTLRRRW